jgi:hypothetical protein
VLAVFVEAQFVKVNCSWCSWGFGSGSKQGMITITAKATATRRKQVTVEQWKVRLMQEPECYPGSADIVEIVILCMNMNEKSAILQK